MDYMSHCCLSLVFDIGQQSIFTRMKIYIINNKTQIFQEKIYLEDDKNYALPVAILSNRFAITHEIKMYDQPICPCFIQ